MIHGPLLGRLLLLSGAMLAVSAGATLASGIDHSLAWGLAMGFALGAAPFASWTWIVSRGLSTRRRRIAAVLLVLAKLGAYSGALYLLVGRGVVNAACVLAGMTAVVLTICVGAAVTGSAGIRSKEAA